MKYKLVCFDLDGTIIDETIFIWQTLHDFLGSDKVKRQKAFDEYMDGKISYSEWADHDLELWKEVGVTKSKMLEAIKPLRLMEGAMETIKELKAKGLKLAIISGSLDIALKYVIPNYEEYFDDVYINKLIFNGEEVNEIVTTKFDFENKASALKEICEKEGIQLSETVFVGDHNNDIQIAEAAGLSIAFNCKSDRLAQVSDHLVKEKDLRKILDLIF